MPLPIVTYTAKRSLIPGVAEGATVTLTLPVRYAGLDPGRDIDRTVHRALSGRREVWYGRGDNSWSISTKPIPPIVAAQMRMFLRSVEDGQTFTFHDGTSLHNAQFDQDSYNEPRQPELDSLVTYQFRLVEVP